MDRKCDVCGEEVLGAEEFIANGVRGHRSCVAGVSVGDCGKNTKFRGSVLIEAHKTINGARQNVYGSPEDSFALIAQYWTTYFRSTIEKQDRSYFTPSDVAMMMALFKIAREANQHKADNIIDCAGYLGIYADMQEGSNAQ